MVKNNIFDFATGELSQDAMICWCLNWFNDLSNKNLHAMALKIIRRISNIDEIDSINILRQFSRTVYRNGELNKENKIQIKIDILLIVNGSVPVIIEDKVFTSEHDDQINRYVEGITELVNNNDGKLIVNQRDAYTIDLNAIRTVFWKTGFLSDFDKVVIADEYMTSKDILGIMEPYSGESEILDSYIAKLKSDLEWYEIHKAYWKYSEEYNECHYDFNLARHEIAQYHMMREIFPETLWERKLGKYYEKYQVYSGSSYGRPWTEMLIYDGVYKDQCEYCIFWRIDTDKKAPYISLRLYEDAYGEATKYLHGKLWEHMRDIMIEIVEENNLGICWNDVNPGNKKNFKEAAIFHFRFDEVIRDNWEQNKAEIFSTIKRINDLFLKHIETIK